MDDLIPLNHLFAGQHATVGTVLGASDHVHRLHEMGLRDGTAVQMVQPGNPCIVRVGSQKVCFRGDELITVLVRLKQPGPLGATA